MPNTAAHKICLLIFFVVFFLPFFTDLFFVTVRKILTAQLCKLAKGQLAKI
jgi:hypothetical protein